MLVLWKSGWTAWIKETFVSSKKGIEKFIRSELITLGSYSAHKSPETLKGVVSEKEIIKLDANENPYGCSPRVNRALAAYPDFNVYPDTDQEEIRKELARYAGIGAEHIVAGSGSNQLIDLIFRLFVGAGDGVINFPPTFDLYPALLRVPGQRGDKTVDGATCLQDIYPPQLGYQVLALLAARYVVTAQVQVDPG